MKFLLSIAALAWCNVIVCAQEPDWVRGKSAEYPDELYVVGVGSGDTRQDAESQARAHIAEVFRVNIKASISVSKTETLKNRQGGVAGETKEVTRSRIDMGLKKTLEGTEIAQVWQNPKDATFYALAVLDREKASLKMSERLRELDDESQRLKQKSDTTVGKINKLRLMLLRKSLMSDRIELDSDLRVVSPAGKGLAAPYSLERENSEIVSFLQSDFVIGVVGDGPGSDVISQTVTDIFTAKGFAVKHTGENTADLLMKVSVNLHPSAEPVDEWYYCRWHLELNASNPQDGSVIFSASENGKSGQLSQDESRKRAVYDMNRKVTALADRVLDRLVGGEE